MLKRLLPLYIAAFFQGFVLWYAVEKLFMHSIGFNDAGIGVMVASYSAFMLLIDAPSGILADRWSRKGVLILASIALVISSFLGGISTEPVLYIVSMLLWGTYFALYFGMYDSMVYDTVLEETGKSDDYERYYGKVTFIHSFSMVLGSFIGGVVGQVSGLPSTFFWSIPLVLCSIVALCYLKEPQLHKAAQSGSVKKQVIETFTAVFKKGTLLKLLIVLIALSLNIILLYEFSQLWFVALDVQPILFGPAWAMFLFAIGIGGLLAGKVRKHHLTMPVAYFTMLVSSLVLVFVQQFVSIMIAQALLGLSSIVLQILFMRKLHDLIPSRVRAGASSAISTMSRLLIIPIALIFGAISNSWSIFLSGWIIVGFVIIILFVALFQRVPKGTNSLLRS